jgi:hypothetical protein
MVRSVFSGVCHADSIEWVTAFKKRTYYGPHPMAEKKIDAEVGFRSARTEKWPF